MLAYFLRMSSQLFRSRTPLPGMFGSYTGDVPRTDCVTWVFTAECFTLARVVGRVGMVAGGVLGESTRVVLLCSVDDPLVGAEVVGTWVDTCWVSSPWGLPLPDPVALIWVFGDGLEY